MALRPVTGSFEPGRDRGRDELHLGRDGRAPMLPAGVDGPELLACPAGLGVGEGDLERLMDVLRLAGWVSQEILGAQVDRPVHGDDPAGRVFAFAPRRDGRSRENGAGAPVAAERGAEIHARNALMLNDMDAESVNAKAAGTPLGRR